MKTCANAWGRMLAVLLVVVLVGGTASADMGSTYDVMRELYDLLGQPVIREGGMVFSNVESEQMFAVEKLMREAKDAEMVGPYSIEYAVDSSELTVKGWFMGIDQADVGICVVTRGEEPVRFEDTLLNFVWDENGHYFMARSATFGYEWVDASQESASARADELIESGAVDVLICDAETARRYAQNGVQYALISGIIGEYSLIPWYGMEYMESKGVNSPMSKAFTVLTDSEKEALEAELVEWNREERRLMLLSLEPAADSQGEPAYCGFTLSYSEAFESDDIGMYILLKDEDFGEKEKWMLWTLYHGILIGDN